jgi:hypothetical protein
LSRAVVVVVVWGGRFIKWRVYSSRANLIKSQHRLPKTVVGLQSNRPTAIQPIRLATNLTQLAGLPPDPSTTPYLIVNNRYKNTSFYSIQKYRTVCVLCLYICILYIYYRTVIIALSPDKWFTLLHRLRKSLARHIPIRYCGYIHRCKDADR